MKKVFGLFFFLAFTGFITLQAQTYGTRAGKVSFSSDTPLEKIEAKNESVSAVLDAASGAFQFSLQVKGFQFDKATMQEHFNENYMESGKFPGSSFKGTVTNIKDVNFSKDGAYPVSVKGALTMHGVTKEIVSKGVITIKSGVATATSSFNITCEDYGIVIPGVVRDKIAKSILIKVNCVLNKM